MNKLSNILVRRISKPITFKFWVECHIMFTYIIDSLLMNRDIFGIKLRHIS